MIRYALASTLIALSLARPGLAEDDTKAMQGTWKPTSAEFGGSRSPRGR